jgi:hypothetical protein
MTMPDRVYVLDEEADPPDPGGECPLCGESVESVLSHLLDDCDGGG